jgi:ketosteroid isomerase-like protein
VAVGGSAPAQSIQAYADALRRRDLPVICRVRDDALVFDPRTLDGDDVEQIAAAFVDLTRDRA